MFKKIIIGTHITEKSMSLAPDKRYTFEVAKNANKAEIAKEIEQIYKVKVVNVNSINIKGKKVRYRQKYQGKRNNRKKALVTIEKTQTIKDFVVKE